MILDDEFLSRAGELLQLLKTLDPWEYWISQLPSNQDDLIAQVCDLYRAATPLQREVFVSALSEEVSAVLGFFATRMAMLSVRQESESILARGLVALVIQLDWPWTDPRDAVIPGLVLIYHSAMKLGVNPDRLFGAAVQVAIRQLTRDLIYPPRAHATEDKLCDLVWWEEVDGPAGLIYHPKRQPIPEGHLIPVVDRQSSTRS